ncbi:MAG TPA: quinol:electron acceptor oxidoreductase subunit ActD [Anaerolineaceae bacterium]
MKTEKVHLALFAEDQIDQAAEAIERLRKFGIPDQNISVISSVPYSEKILGRPMSWTRIPLIAISGAVVGFLVSLLLSFGTPLLYPMTVGGLPLLAIPTSIVVTFELTMLGLLISTFIGVFVETISPSFGPKGYHKSISDGSIGVLFICPLECDERMHASLVELGARLEHYAEEKLWL